MYLDSVTVDVNKLAEQLVKVAGPITKAGWEIYLRQQYIEGFQDLFAALIWGILSVGFGLWAWRIQCRHRGS